MEKVFPTFLRVFAIGLFIFISTVVKGQCPEPLHPDRAAILSFYNSLNGPNWPTASFQNWHDLANEVICDPCLLEGITCSNSRITVINLGNQPLISGSIPNEIENLSNLIQLDINNCDIVGAIPSTIGNLADLEVIDLRSNNISGQLPIEMSNLAQLRIIELGGNNISGTIPNWIGDLGLLEILILDSNNFSGTIPASIGNLSNLIAFRAGPNNLTGTIPPSISNLSSLTVLYLRGNGLTGEIPAGLGNLPLTLLSLANNDLGGCLPSDLSNLCTKTVQIFSNPQLGDQQDFSTWCTTGIIDVDNDGLCANIDCDDNDPSDGSSIAFTSLADISVDAGIQTGLSGGTPVGGVYSGVGVTDDGNGQTFTFDPSIPGEGITTITYSNIACGTSATSDITVISGGCPDPQHPDKASILSLYNALDGPNWPAAEFQNWHDLANEVICDPCLLEGITCVNSRITIIMHNNHPEILGMIPENISGLTELEVFWLSNSNIQGTLPLALMNFSKLDRLILFGNQISGEIPSEISNLNLVTEINLSSNLMEGEIPASLWSLENLRSLKMGFNNLIGELPLTVTGLNNLIEFNLNSNQLSGTIPDWVGDISSLISLNLSLNQFTGEIPSNLLPVVLLLNDNLLSGCIPESLLAKCSNGSVNLTNNIDLSYGGDFTAFCTAGYTDADNDGTCADLDCDDNDPTDGSSIAFTSLADISVDAGIQTGLSGGTPVGGVYSGVGVTDDGNGQTFTFDPSIPGEGITTITYSNIDCGTSATSDITVISSGCPDPQHPDKAAILSLYNALDGPNWPVAEFQNWHDLANAVICDPCLLEGITCANDRVENLVIRDEPLVTGELPSEIGNLTTLKLLTIDKTQINGIIPSELGDLSLLLNLNLTDNALTGDIPQSLGNLSSLTQLQLHGNELTESLPIELGNLSSLQTLTLYNNNLSGAIPTEIGNLTSLQILWAFNNQFSGQIPSELGNLSSIVQLLLYRNQLSGAIPAELGNLSSLQSLLLYRNQLNGEVPLELGNLLNLQQLQLQQNDLEGCLPANLLNLCGKNVNLTSNTLLGDQQDFNNWCSTGIIDIDNDGLCANVDCDDNDPENGLTIAFAILDDVTIDAGIQTNLSGGTPTGGIYSGVGVTDDGNGLTFTFDPSIPGEGITTITYSNIACGTSATSDIAVISGGCPNPLHPDRVALLAIYHALDGPNWNPDPSDIDRFWDQFADGTLCSPCITPDISLLARTTCKNGRINSLTFGDLSGSLNLRIGELPPEVGDLTELESLFINNSLIEGALPSSLVQLSNLMDIVITSNDGLTGEILSDIGQIGSLQQLILLNNPNISGNLPPSLGDLDNLKELTISGNNTSGSIPSQLGNLAMLETLNLSNSNLSDEIPASLGQLANLVSLRLSENELIGRIPEEIGNQAVLTELDLSTNNLEGCLPSNLFNLCRGPFIEGEIDTGPTSELFDVLVNISNNPLLQYSDGSFYTYCRDGYIDVDNDGFCPFEDCDDTDPLVTIEAECENCPPAEHTQDEEVNRLIDKLKLNSGRE